MISDDEAVRVYRDAWEASPGGPPTIALARATLAMLRALGVLPAEVEPADGAEDDARAQAVSVTADLRAAVEGVTELIAALERQRVQIGETMAREDADAALLRDQIAQLAERAEGSRAYAERCMRERDEAREALDSIGDMLIGIEPGLDGDACRVVGRCISDAKWRKQPEFSERPASLRGEIARLALARDEALAEAKRWQGSGVYATALEALLCEQREGESIVDVVPRLVRERDQAREALEGTRAILETALGQARDAREAQARAEQSARRAQEQAARDLGTTPEGLETVRAVLMAVERYCVRYRVTRHPLTDALDPWIAAGKPLAGGEL